MGQKSKMIFGRWESKASLFSKIVKGSLRGISHVCMRFLKLFFITGGLFLTGVLLLIVRVSLGPLDVSFLKSFIEDPKYFQESELRPKVDKIFLKFNGVHEPISMVAEGVSVFNDQGQALLKVPTLFIHADYADLLKGRLSIKSLAFLAPNFDVSLGEKLQINPAENPQGPEAFIGSFLKTLFDAEKNQPPDQKRASFQNIFPILEEIFIENASLQIKNEEGVSLLKGRFNCKISLEEEKREFLEINIKAFHVEVHIPAWDRRTFPIPEIEISGAYHLSHRTFSFAIPPFNWQGTWAKAQGGGAVLEEITLYVDFEPDLLPLNRFSHVWPENLAQSTRSWILENISEGNIDKINVHLEGKIPCFQEKKETPFFNATQLKGGFHINGINVDYIEGLPLAQDVSAIARFDQDTFNIEILKGHVEDVNVTKGMIHFYDLSTDTELSEIKLSLKGSLPHILKIISNPPLEYPQHIGITPEDFQGEAFVDLVLNFPLLKYLTLEKVEVLAKTSLKNISYFYDFSQNKDTKTGKSRLYLEKGNFDLEVDKKHLLLKGMGELEGFKTEIFWAEAFQGKGPYSRKLSLKGTYPIMLFERFGVSLEKFMTGNLGLSINIEENRDKSTHLDVKGDLEGVEVKIPELHLHKKAEEKGKISFLCKQSSASHPKESLWEFSGFLFESPSARMEGKASFNAQSQDIEMVNFNSIKTPKTDMSLFARKIKPHLYDVKIYGRCFDAESFFKDLFDGSSPKEQKGKSPLQDHTKKEEKPFDIILDLILDELWTRSDISIKSLRLSLKKESARIESLKCSGILKGGETVSIQYGSFGKIPGYFLNLHTSDAGQFLKLINVYDDMEGGKLTIKGVRPSSSKAVLMEGEISLNQFRLLKTPVLAKILSLASLEGLSSFFQGHQGVFFDQALLKFQANEDKVLLSEGLAESSSTGVTLSGKIDRAQKTLDLKGNIIPLYLLNSLIGNIPLLGQILSGGKNQGFLAVTYKVIGAFEDLNVSVNPLSMLAPGFIREIF